MANRDRPCMSPQAYLEWEAQQPEKYEYLNGEVYAMTGGFLPHNNLAVNLTTLLKAHLQGKGCKVRMADAKRGSGAITSEQHSPKENFADISVRSNDRSSFSIIHL
ncbi:MAG TPA: Uma2 family endonuclease [Synechococcales cyanobacterium M55_K2018_004]|nr:Uma2 family endonuclease [Synechococcales cyanobacterium M55_K2018_004]